METKKMRAPYTAVELEWMRLQTPDVIQTSSPDQGTESDGGNEGESRPDPNLPIELPADTF